MTIITHDNSTAKVEREIPHDIFLSAPMTMYREKAYDTALYRITRCYPQAAILSARDLWTSSEHWRTTHRDVLAMVDFCYILTDSQGYVGKGVHAEHEYLAERKVPFVALLPDNLECREFTLKIINPDNWQQYAGVLPPEPPFKTSTAFQLMAHAALANPHHIHPVYLDDWTGQQTPIPRKMLYAALIGKDRDHGEAA